MLVIGAFTTLAEAERATQALLEAGYHADDLCAMARVGGGRVLLAGRVGVRSAGEPARLVSRADRAGASAVLGGALGTALTGAALTVAHLSGIDLLGPLGAMMPGWPGTAAAVAGGAAVCAGIGALSRRTQGLPHDLAMRFGMRLDQGDAVLAVTTVSATAARAVQEVMSLHGAVLAYATHGTLELRGDPPAPVTLLPSGN